MSENATQGVEPMTWQGDNPFCVVISRGIDDSLLVDLDRPGWTTEYAEWMRAPGRWFLVRKTDMQPVLWMVIHEGEQPYYSTRHTGFASTTASMEILSHGIGKKRVDGHVDRVWVLPNGAVTLGDDVDVFALEMLKARQK